MAQTRECLCLLYADRGAQAESIATISQLGQANFMLKFFGTKVRPLFEQNHETKKDPASWLVITCKKVEPPSLSVRKGDFFAQA